MKLRDCYQGVFSIYVHYNNGCFDFCEIRFLRALHVTPAACTELKWESTSVHREPTLPFVWLGVWSCTSPVVTSPGAPLLDRVDEKVMLSFSSLV